MTSSHCHTTEFSYVVAILKTNLVLVIGWLKWYIALHLSAWYLLSTVDDFLASSLQQKSGSRRMHHLYDLQYYEVVSASLAKPLSILNEALAFIIPSGPHSFYCVTIGARDRLHFSLMRFVRTDFFIDGFLNSEKNISSATLTIAVGCLWCYRQTIHVLPWDCFYWSF